MKDEMNIYECAAYLGTTKDGVYSKVKRNEIPYEKKRGRLVFSRKQLKAMEQIKSAELIKDELIKGFVAKNPALSAFVQYGDMLTMFESIASNFPEEVQRAYLDFVTKYASHVVRLISGDYKKSNLNEN